MSRLIVKGLPDRITEVRLTDLFKKYGDLTNVQLKYTPQGKFRKFGFVGFKAKDSADAAIKELDKTFLEGSKLMVEVCAKLSDANRKTWSKYSRLNQNKPEQVKVENEEKKKKKKPKPGDPEYAEYEEFMALHRKKSERQKWADGVGLAEEESGEVEEGEEEQGDGGLEDSDLQFLKSKKVSRLSDDEEEPEDEKQVAPEEGAEQEEDTGKGKKKKLKHGALPTVKLRGLPYKCQKGDIKKFFLPLKPFHVRMPKVHGIAFVTFKTPDELHKALKKHRSFLEGKRILVTRKEEAALEVKEEKFQRLKKLEEKLMAEEEPIGESGRIFIRNLPYSTTEEDIEELFKPFGELSEVHMPINQVERRSMGIAFVTFMFPEHAAKAFQELDGEIFQGRLLHLLPAKPSRPKPDEETQGEDSTYKAKKRKELKSTAMGSQHSWNTLFLGANAVVDVMAEKYRVSKQRVLGNEGDTSAAVRTALGETELVAETRRFLVANGVSLDAFSRPPNKRSKRIILAKNLPAGTESEKLKEKFAKFGVVEKLILPPTGVTAIVVMDNPAEARSAFQTLAYSNFKNSPLYLEWAPDDVFQAQPDAVPEAKKEVEVKEEKEPQVLDEPPEPETTIFVKNVNFDTTDEQLKEHFIKCGKIHSATISRKPDPKRQGEMLSMGYGFVQYKKKASAQRALKELQHSRLDDHPLELKLSHKTSAAEAKSGGRKTTDVGPMSVPKIMVRNIPFQANQKEVHDLFRTFGDIQAVRLPKKHGQQGEHRGFGFVHFTSQETAKRAFEALVHSTHLYGRRLVLEWAKGEETVSDIRKRTASHFVAGSSKSKKSKTFGVESDEEGE